MRERLRADPFGVVAAASVTLACVLVAAAGGVALVAELVGSWRSLFLMERALNLLVPAVLVLLAVAVAAGAGLVLRPR